MTSAPSPLATPLVWNLVSTGYAEESFDQFAKYSADALRLAGVKAGERVLDVCAGPGSLVVQAAQLGSEVHGIDFAADMLRQLEQRVEKLGLRNVSAREGDGQALPHRDGEFDAAFSMFGLIFFPDRARGFRELWRVLKPGGRAVVSSWQPLLRVPTLVAVFQALAQELPNLPFGDGKGPLSDPEEFRAEMSAAGFSRVTVEERVHVEESPDIGEFWRVMRRSLAPLVLLEHKLGSATFEPVAAGIERRLRAQFTGPVRIEMPAWLGLGHRE